MVVKTGVLMAAMAAAASGYYHFVHFGGRNGPFLAIFERFDVGALPSKTAFIHVSEQSPSQYAANDGFPNVLSQIRAAAKVWNDVEASDLRVEYAGVFTPGTPQNSPGIEVVFEDLPPGVYGYGGPTVRSDAVSASGTVFVPITRSVVVLPRDLSRRPSYGEGFFLTAVHELGHALGLQHSLASGVMSTEYTRGVTRASPLTADDVAGISLLYPNRAQPQNAGSIAGRVLAGGDGVSMASVVAISPSGPAVSALTNPDGTYRIEGLPPGQYFLYAHPLPPPLPGYVTPADVRLPVDLANRSFDPGPSFDTVFYPGTRDPQQVVSVGGGFTTENLNFFVQRRATPAIHTVQTYSFPAQVAVKPAYLSKSASRWWFVAAGTGLTANNAPAPGLGVGVLGGAVSLIPGGIRPYAPAPASYVQLDFQLSPIAPEGPGHLVFSANNDIYVLPNAFRIVQRQAPAISAVVPAADPQAGRVVLVAGSGFTADTRVLFDGVAAQVRSVDESAGRVLVVPPAAPLGHRANVVALNTDGQSSLFLQATPPTYVYDGAEPQAVSQQAFVVVTPQVLQAGTESMVEINGFNTNFVDGMTTVGFGSSDIVVRRLAVVSQTRMLANVAVAAQSPFLATSVTVTSGLHSLVQYFGVQVLPGNPRQISLSLVAANGQRGPTAGGTAVVTATSLSAGLAGGLSVTLSDRPAQVLSVVGNQVAFQVPANASPGPAVLRLQAGADVSLPLLVVIEPPPPQIFQVTAGLVTQIDQNRPARPGELLNVLLNGFADLTTPPGRVTIQVAGLDHLPVFVNPLGSLLQVQFLLSPQLPAGQWPMTITVDGRQSQTYFLPVR